FVLLRQFSLQEASLSKSSCLALLAFESATICVGSKEACFDWPFGFCSQRLFPLCFGFGWKLLASLACRSWTLSLPARVRSSCLKPYLVMSGSFALVIAMA